MYLLFDSIETSDVLRLHYAVMTLSGEKNRHAVEIQKYANMYQWNTIKRISHKIITYTIEFCVNKYINTKQKQF